MDAFKLLSRSTNLKSGVVKEKLGRTVPSEGPSVAHQQPPSTSIYPSESQSTSPSGHNKRKRDSEDAPDRSFFPTPSASIGYHISATSNRVHSNDLNESLANRFAVKEAPRHPSQPWRIPTEQCRSILKQHKVKVVNLTELHKARQKDADDPIEGKPKGSGRPARPTSYQGDQKGRKEAYQVVPHPLTSFDQLRTVYRIRQPLVDNVFGQGYTVPTEVQMASLPLLLVTEEPIGSGTSIQTPTPNLLTVAPTGSGKTLAFLIPLINEIARRHHSPDNKADRKGVSALIVAPTKELVAQIVNEGRKMTQNVGVRISAMRKGMSLDLNDPDSESGSNGPGIDEGNHSHTIVKSDILVTTPLLIVNALSDDHVPNNALLPSIQNLVLDEADVLLDPLFRDQTLALWDACVNPRLQVSLWSATIGSNIEELALSVIKERELELGLLDKAPLLRCVVGLKDSALPTISHKLVYAATELGKLLGIRQLLHPTPAVDGRRATPPLRPPFLVFTQTIERAVALHSELLYDIPSEAGGSSRVSVLHSDLSDSQRSDVMARFRKGQIWVLITTDLLSRGVDFRGVNGVVNYDIPTTSAAYVHRVGRTGRAGREGGIAVTFYTKEDIKYVKGIANMIAASERVRDRKGEDETSVEKWLLNALPDISKKEKKQLKLRGVEVRRNVKPGEDAKLVKAKRKAKISTKSGYERKLKNNWKGAVLGSQRRKSAGVSWEEDEWSGIGE